jgi:hypothetical protein
MFSDDLFQELDSKFQSVGKASAIDIDLVRFTSLAIKTFFFFFKAKLNFM